jgi:hypothetical protein
MKGTPTEKVEFLDRMQHVLWNCRIVRTRGKDVGIAPRKSQVSDIICVFYGCSVPIVLRPIEGTKGFQFIGECYVHGIMDGEALDKKHLRAKERWFKLR